MSWIGMIIRARPKYITESMFTSKRIENTDNSKKHLYFSSGRAGLKFLLSQLSSFFDKKINVLIQDFNCHVVAQSVLESNCKLFLGDVSLKHFSINFDTLKKNVDKIDVLILTHYQGIPNYDYLNIIDLCRLNNIFVIEDMAQTFGSKIDNIAVGTLGIASLESYAFDKPFSVLRGGRLSFNEINNDMFELIMQSYSKLEYEADSVANQDLAVLSYIYKYSSSKHYHNGINFSSIISLLKKLHIKDDTISKVTEPFYMKYLNSIYSFFDKENEITIKRMNMEKIKFITAQREKYDYSRGVIDDIERMSRSYNLEPISCSRCEINWNRFSILDKNERLKSVLNKKGIEASNYNWPKTIEQFLKKNSNFTILDSLKNSKYVSENILNIPIWEDKLFSA
jgi:dTDP-4-amino-4,6-dideoxygalactose transaminase